MVARQSYIRSDHIEYGFWLVFDDGGGVKAYRAEPRLARNERSMFLTAKLPLALWSVPSLRASIDVTADSAPTINLEIATEALRSALGVDVDLRVMTPDA